MTNLSGKIVSRMNIKTDANVFHEQLTIKLPTISEICPEIIERIDLLRGQWGTVGSTICWIYIDGGKKHIAKEIIEAIDNEKKSVTFTIIEGDVLDFYNTFKATVGVEAKSELGHSVVTWTMEYEKKTHDVPDPHPVMVIAENMTKQIDRHLSLVSN